MRKEVFAGTAARVAEWASQPRVLGVVLVGSKSRAHADELSDDDLEVVLADEEFARLTPLECLDLLVEGEGDRRRLIYDAQYTSLADLRRKAGSPRDLDHWPYEQARVLFDRDGDVAEAVAAAARMDPEFRRLRLLHATIDAWIAPRRAAKTLKRGYQASALLLVARGARALARVIFALEGRWVPLDHWLEAELSTLQDPAQVGPDLKIALTTGDPLPLEAGLARLEDRLSEEGVPRAADRRDLFLELIHPTRAADAAIHFI